MADAPQIRKAWDMVDEAKKEIENLSVEQVKAELDEGRAMIVDIRDFRERYLRGAIPGAFSADRGMLEFWIDPASEYYRDVFTPDKRYILYCAGGGRSALSAKTMKDMGFDDVAHLEAGFTGWADAGMPVEDCKANAKWVLRSDVDKG
jgi:rhodanese-related sulfurtransferase